jgi:S-adenosylmethionine-dependent methyltransferase
MAKDKNFDVHKERFKRNIYDTPKGLIRLNILTRDLEAHIPDIHHTTLNILDAGCGMGQLSLQLAKRGHLLTLCDMSTEMIQQASELFLNEGNTASFHHKSIQEFCTQSPDQYDIVLSHAVLEWVENPVHLIEALSSKVKPGGYLSLMFYNVNAAIMFNLLKGNFRKVIKDDFSGHPGGLTPTNPIDPDDVDKWLIEAGFHVKARTGVRVLYDYLSRDLRQNRSLEDIMELEYQFSTKSPFNMLGRYLHYVCTKSR